MSTLPTTSHKDSYKIRNWKEYNGSLCRRGRITLWLHDSVFDEWEEASQKSKRVGERTYCDSIIEVLPVVENQLWAETTPEYGFS